MKNVLISILLILGLYFFAFREKFRPAPDADAFIGHPGPALQVEQWISTPPKTEGKYLLVDFWATWCGPCIRAIPHLNDLHATFKDQLTIVGLSRESQAKVASMESPRMDYYSAIDTQARLGSHFKIRSIPHVVLMDPHGIVIYKGHPAYLTKEKVAELISAN